MGRNFFKKTAALLATVEGADLVLLAFPLYVDTLPGPVIEALERIAADTNNPTSKRGRFAAIVNCGFPEAFHCENSIAVCRNFAAQAGFDWAGALLLGGGEMIHGAPLEELGGRTVRIRKALTLAAEALGNGATIPREACDLMARPAVPGWLYRLFGGMGWKKQAKKYGVHRELRRRPYAQLGS